MIDKAIMRFPGIKKTMGLLAGLSVLQAIFIIGQAYSLSMAISNLWNGQALSSQFVWIFSFLFFFMARHLIILIRDRYLDNFAYRQASELRKNLLEKIFRAGPNIVQDKGTGNTVTMALEGIEQVENYIHLILSKMTNMLLIPLILLVAIFLFDIESGVVLLLVFPLIIIFMIILGYAAQTKANNQYRAFQLLSNHFIDSLRGIDTLKLFGLSKKYGKSIFSTSERFRKATMSTLKVAILSTFALDFFTTLAVAIVAVLLGLRLIEGNIFLFPALTTLILAPEYFLPIRDFAGDYHATLDGKNAMTAVREILEEPETVMSATVLKEWQKDSQLSIENLNFSYQNFQALQNISSTISGFQKIGIIGLSGSGKSTLINLLSGFTIPENGKISYENQTLTSFKEKDWQKQLAYIPQNPYLFQRSFRENIAFYYPEASDEKIREAIEVVGLSQLVAELPNGLDTQIGEGARTLSGGQAQRIALARTFLDQERRILLFDEPTAHLDIETEVELKQKMLPLMENKLVFFATHRLHWMQEMDYILVLDEGKIVEAGTLAELMNHEGAYLRLSQRLKEGIPDGKN